MTSVWLRSTQPSLNRVEVLHIRRPIKERSDDRAPLGEQLAAAEAHGVVFQTLPFDHQHIALGRFDAVLDLRAEHALRFGQHRRDGVLQGLFELGLLPLRMRMSAISRIMASVFLS